MKRTDISIDAEAIQAAETVLGPNEDIQSFVEAAVRSAVARRQQYLDLMERALAARNHGKLTGEYIDDNEMLKRLEAIVARKS